MNILFICTGNTCRSPMAEAILRKEMPTINVKSAGIFASENAPASPQAVSAMDQKGIQLVHKSKQVTESLLQWADLVLTMTKNHEQLLRTNYPQFTSKIFPLKSYTNDGTKVSNDIADPFGGDLALYEQTAEELEKEIAIIVEKIKQ